jgi:Adenosine-deaminase (editase) domain
MSDAPPAPSPTKNNQKKKKRALRYVEARRTGSCAFADRIAALSIEHYRRCLPEPLRLPPTCLATIIAAFREANATSTPEEGPVPQQCLVVCAMGVGTKFLSQEVLSQEEEEYSSHTPYGTRIRDAHAEVLVRRAFRRYLGECMEQLKKNERSDSILERAPTSPSAWTHRNTPSLYQLRSNVTLHMYCSSTPCGNSTIKKFATLRKETYCSTLSGHQWPSSSSDQHIPIPLHSIPLGQCALLLKRDRSHAPVEEVEPSILPTTATKKQRAAWPIYTTLDWCPPGTTPTWSGEGQLHSCSDKLARWNYLGLQGAWLSSLLTQPLYLTTLTVGRKFSAHTSRRAVCCRLYTRPAKPPAPTEARALYSLHHPVVLGTGVYMDADGVHDLDARPPEDGTTVRFHSSRAFASWWQPPPVPGDGDNAGPDHVAAPHHMVECLDGSTGWLYGIEDDAAQDGGRRRSQICTAALMEQYWRIQEEPCSFPHPRTLAELRRYKRRVAPAYERAKRQLLTRHPVLRDWKRRRVDSVDDNAPVPDVKL